VLLLANSKADAIIKSNRIPSDMNHEILLTADQVVVYDNKILEKPKDLLEARTFIRGYGVKPCSTVG
jgi:predicted house-cleaning NTP pyrophosphatase (Maf/HAM1 superfamily)